MIIGITGRKGSGKDTIADHLISKYGFEKLSFAKPLKDMCKLVFNFTEEQVNGDLKEVIDPQWNQTPRVILQYVGTDLFRNQMNKILDNIGDNFWVQNLKLRCLQKIKENKDCKLVITDVRFPNEFELIKELNGQMIRVLRVFSLKEEDFTETSDSHISETSLDDAVCDYNIINDSSLDSLYRKIDDIEMIN